MKYYSNASVPEAPRLDTTLSYASCKFFLPSILSKVIGSMSTLIICMYPASSWASPFLPPKPRIPCCSQRQVSLTVHSSVLLSFLLPVCCSFLLFSRLLTSALPRILQSTMASADCLAFVVTTASYGSLLQT